MCILNLSKIFFLFFLYIFKFLYFKGNIPEKRKVHTILGGKKGKEGSCHTDQVLSIALSSDDKFLVCFFPTLLPSFKINYRCLFIQTSLIFHNFVLHNFLFPSLKIIYIKKTLTVNYMVSFY